MLLRRDAGYVGEPLQRLEVAFDGIRDRLGEVFDVSGVYATP